MNRANGVSENTARRIERRFSTMNSRLEAGAAAAGRGIALAFASVAAVRGATQLVDSATRIENSLKVVGLRGEELEKVYNSLFQSAQRNMAPLETLTTLYSRLGLAQKELGVTNDELLNFTDKVALALRVQGTTAQEARGALIQLSQAMGSGIVRAEEFNSVVEGAPSILRAAAAGLKEANGSVAQLRQLVVDGKLSSAAFFRAFEAGAVILEEQVAAAEVTVSQGFVRLQNVLTDVAGKMNEGTAASGLLASGLSNLADGVENFGTWLESEGDSVQAFFADVSAAITQMQRASRDAGRSSGLSGFGRFVEDLTGLKVSSDYATGSVRRTADAIDRLTGGATEADLAIAEAEQALATFALNGASQFGELEPVVNDFIQQLLEGKGTAETAAEAINAIGEAGDFGSLITDLSGLVTALFSVRSEAMATAAAVAAAKRGDTSVTNIADQRAEQLATRPKPAVTVTPISMADYPVGGAGAGGAGGSGGKKSSAQKYGDDVAQMERRIAALQRETQLQRSLNPLVDDYGYAVERLRAQMELENAAAEAGLELTPERREQIEELASSYAMASSEAARLAESQDLVRESAEAMGQAGRQALDTLIDGFLEGKDAGEIFKDVLRDIGRSLLNMGISGFGTAFKIPGFATGTSSAPGGLARINEFGGEIVNLPKGAQVIPHDISMQMARAAGGNSGGPNVTFAPVIDARGADIAAVARIEQVLARQSAEFEGRVKQIVKGRGHKWR